MSQKFSWNILYVLGVCLGSGKKGVEKHKTLSFRSLHASQERVDSELLKCVVYDVKMMGGNSTW